MQDISVQIKQRKGVAEKLTRSQVPLSLFISNNKGFIQWRFGPYVKGEYRLLSEEYGSFVMPAQGYFKLGLKVSIPFYLQYISPAGWKTYSPLFVLPEDGTPVQWERKSIKPAAARHN